MNEEETASEAEINRIVNQQNETAAPINPIHIDVAETTPAEPENIPTPPIKVTVSAETIMGIVASKNFDDSALTSLSEIFKTRANAITDVLVSFERLMQALEQYANVKISNRDDIARGLFISLLKMSDSEFMSKRSKSQDDVHL